MSFQRLLSRKFSLFMEKFSKGFYDFNHGPGEGFRSYARNTNKKIV